MAVPVLTVGTPVDGAGSHVNSPPAGTVQNNLLICYCWLDINTSTVSTPGGWTLLHGPIDTASTADARLYVFAKLAGASEGSTTFTDNLGGRNWTSVIVGVTGNDTTALGTGAGDGAIDRTATSTPATGTSAATASITPTVNECLIIGAAHADLSASSSPNWTPPSGWSEDLDYINATSFVTGTVAHIDQATAAAISGTFTSAVSDEIITHIIAVAPGDSGPMVVTIGQAVETNFAQPIINPNATTSAPMRVARQVMVMGRRRFVTVTTVAAGFAEPAGGGQQGTVNQVAETDISQATTRIKSRVVGQVTETDISQTITRVRSRVLGQPTETDVSQTTTRLKTRVIGQATETDNSQALIRVKTKTLGQATETDVAQVIVRQTGVGQPVETDIAQALTRVKTKTLGQTLETDVSQSTAELKTRVLGQATETDTAQTIGEPAVLILTAPIPYNMIAPLGVVTVQQATETNIAQSITRVKTRAVGQVTETDSVTAVARLKVRVVAQSTETDISQAIVSGVRTGTQLYLTTIAAEPGVTVGAGTRHRFHWDAGNSATVRNKNTVAGPTAPLQVTDSSTPGTDGTAVSWYSNQLEAVTISGAITIELWAEESGG